MIELDPTRLAQRCEPALLDFRDTRDLDALDDHPGQGRALEAIRFATELPHAGFNLFVMGRSETGKLEATSDLLRALVAERMTSDDWCYVNNFDDPTRPRAIRIAAGQGARLREDVAQLVDELSSAIPAVFESEDYQARLARVDAEFNSLQENALGELIAQARPEGVALWRTPSGFSFAPARNGDAMPAEEFEKLPDEERKRIGTAIERLQGRLDRLMRQVIVWRRGRRSAIKELNQQVTGMAVVTLVDDLIRRYLMQPAVVDFLLALQRDVISHAELFQGVADGPQADGAGAGPGEVLAPLPRYQVNVIVTRIPGSGLPVVIEDNPTLSNLMGRVEYQARYGALMTDFGMIKAGAMHRAAGGFLLVDARRVLMQPFAWDALKRALITREIRIESIGQQYGLISTVSLEPEPIPFDARVVLFGDRWLHAMLQALDPDFSELFRIAPEFVDDAVREDLGIREYARWLAGIAGRSGVRPFDRAAIARLIDWSARETTDAGRLSLHIRRIADLMVEADRWAGRSGASRVGASHLDQALEARRERSDAYRRRMHELILNDTVLIATSGVVPGQINGLAVIQVGELQFGLPTRITATTRVGEGGVVDIQRESRLSGAIHTKAVMILSAWLAARYSALSPLALSASLVFEQTYGQVDGDSASLAEACSLLSSLSGVPIRQSLAVTGSLNQKGMVQAIGGVNEKIEGFFEICRARGLDGSQGVLVPADNCRHLMLRDDVVDAVRAGRFRVLAVREVDEAVALLMAGEGRWPTQPTEIRSVVRAIDQLIRSRLRTYAGIRSRRGVPEPASRRGRG
jgi:predicted ATP-dependent protease